MLPRAALPQKRYACATTGARWLFRILSPLPWVSRSNCGRAASAASSGVRPDSYAALPPLLPSGT